LSTVWGPYHTLMMRVRARPCGRILNLEELIPPDTDACHATSRKVSPEAGGRTDPGQETAHDVLGDGPSGAQRRARSGGQRRRVG
jgi:hypothetical protein